MPVLDYEEIPERPGWGRVRVSSLRRAIMGGDYPPRTDLPLTSVEGTIYESSSDSYWLFGPLKGCYVIEEDA